MSQEPANAAQPRHSADSLSPVPDSSPVPLAEKPVHQLDGLLLRQIFEAALHWLENHAATINALNVFPVPDGDTGTNMLMTLRSALRQASQQSSTDAAEMARQLALGAVKGARGNSGVILSQIINGFARAGEGKAAYTTADLAHCLRKACDSAYNAVMKPVEGTILTVISATADAAEDAADETTDVCEFISHATQAARQALQRTPELLPILKEAGVVDSGGQGLVTIFEGMSRCLRGELIPSMPSIAQPVVLPTAQLEHPPAPLADGRYGYDIQFLIQGENLDVETIRQHISELGDCPLVVGNDNLVKVHVHALSPAPALAYGVSLGMIDDVVVENMDLQFEAFARRAEGSATTSLSTESVTGVGIVAVAPGEGLAEHFKALGASLVVEGGQSMNPSTEDFLQAIEAVRAEAVILLPNNKNVIMAAEQARGLADVPVYVVPTRSTPQGLAALMAFDYSQDAASNAEIMAEAMRHVETLEVTRAARSTSVAGLAVQEGDVIGLRNGQLVARGTEDAEVIAQVLAQLELEEYEIAAVYYGAERTQESAQALVDTLAARYPGLVFDLHAGGQPHYTYILAIE